MQSFSMSSSSSTFLIFLGLSASVAGHTLLVQYSRQQPGPKYSTSSVVLLSEALKLMAGLAVVSKQLHVNRKAPASLSDVVIVIYEDIVSNFRDVFRTCIPSLLYAIQNNLVLVSLSNLDASTFLMTSQLKIFFTAFFMWLLMGRTFSRQRCLALVFLCAGEMLVHWENMAYKGGGGGHVASASSPHATTTTVHCFDDIMSIVPNYKNHVVPVEQLDQLVVQHNRLERCTIKDVLLKRAAVDTTAAPSTCLSSGTCDVQSRSYLIGLCTTLLTCVGSGFSGVYVEIVLKSSQCSFWIRNVQMYIWGVISNGLIVLLSQGDDGLFYGFDEVTFLIIFTSALVGFCTACIMQRLDNIWKNLASSASVVMTTVASAIIFGTPVGLNSSLGTVVLIMVPWLYHTG